MFQLNNAGNIGAAEGTTPKQLEPLSWNPAVVFRRARISCGGVVVEDIDNFNRLSLMLMALKTEEEQHSIAGKDFCNLGFKGTSTDSRSTYRLEDYGQAGYVGVSRRVLFKPIFDFFNQDMLLPLRYCPIQTERELLNSFTDAIVVRDANDLTDTALLNISDIQ